MKICLVGLGSVSAGYGFLDEHAPYCHVGGILKTEHELSQVVEPSEENFQKAAAKWKFKACKRVSFEEAEADCFAIATPSGTHFLLAQEILLRKKCSLLVIEKPPAESIEDARALVRLAAEKGVEIRVSYTNGWSPELADCVKLVRNGELGKIVQVVGYGGGPVISHACHVTSMLFAFVSERLDQFVISSGLERKGEGLEPFLRSLWAVYSRGEDECRISQIGAKGPYGSNYVEVFGSEGWLRVGARVKATGFARGKEMVFERSKPESPFAALYNPLSEEKSFFANWFRVFELGMAACGGGRVKAFC